MDFVARAKALLAGKARIGLMILPLAAAVPAMASSLPTDNYSCTLNGSPLTSCTSTSTVQQLATGNGIEGLKFFGPVSGGFYVFNGFSGSGITFQTNGVLTGADILAGTVIPFSYHFNIGLQGCCSVSAFTLSFNIFQASGGSANGSVTVSGGVVGEQSGSGSILVTSTLFGNSFTTFVNSNLNLTSSFDGGFATLSIPSNSIDINPVLDAGVPEPASIALTGFGIALAAGFRLVRRRKGFVIVKDSNS